MNLMTHPLASVWINFNRRCLDPNDPSFSSYGGRGIGVAPEWRWIKGNKTHNHKAFHAFLAYVGERPPRMSLDRINNNLGYEPGNVRWATPRQQSNNRGPNMTRTPVSSQLSDADMVRWNVFLSVKLIAKLKEMGKKRGVSAAEIVRVALEKYVAAVEKAALEAKNVA
jgi:hypothetical protein